MNHSTLTSQTVSIAIAPTTPLLSAPNRRGDANGPGEYPVHPRWRASFGGWGPHLDVSGELGSPALGGGGFIRGPAPPDRPRKTRFVRGWRLYLSLAR